MIADVISSTEEMQRFTLCFFGTLVFNSLVMHAFYKIFGDKKCVDGFPLYAQWYSIFANLLPIFLINYPFIFASFLSSKYIYDFYHLRNYPWPTLIIVHHLVSLVIFTFPLYAMEDPTPYILVITFGKIGSASFCLYLITGWLRQYFYVMTITHVLGLIAGLPGVKDIGTAIWAIVCFFLVFFRQKNVTKEYFKKNSEICQM